jgi:hypothetical protein
MCGAAQAWFALARSRHITLIENGEFPRIFMAIATHSHNGTFVASA